MASVTIDISKVIKGLTKIKVGVQDMSFFFRNVAELELSETKLRFRNQEDPDGKKWPDSFTIRRNGGGGGGGYTREQSWNYVKKSNYKAAPPGWHFFSRSFGDKILNDTGNLSRSIGSSFGKDFAIVGTNVEYAKKHQEGDGVKQRRFLGVNKKTDSNIQKALDSYMKGLLK